MSRKPEKPDRVDVVKGHPIDGPVIWFELSEVDTRLLAKRIVSSELQEQALACIAWLEDDPINFQDEEFMKLAKQVG